MAWRPYGGVEISKDSRMSSAWNCRVFEQRVPASDLPAVFLSQPFQTITQTRITRHIIYCNHTFWNTFIALSIFSVGGIESFRKRANNRRCAGRRSGNKLRINYCSCRIFILFPIILPTGVADLKRLNLSFWLSPRRDDLCAVFLKRISSKANQT